MALALLRRHRQLAATSLQQLRRVSTSLAAGQDAEEAGEGLKKMNLCTAVNDALHIAMATDKKWVAMRALAEAAERTLCRANHAAHGTGLAAPPLVSSSSVDACVQAQHVAHQTQHLASTPGCPVPLWPYLTLLLLLSCQLPKCPATIGCLPDWTLQGAGVWRGRELWGRVPLHHWAAGAVWQGEGVQHAALRGGACTLAALFPAISTQSGKGWAFFLGPPPLSAPWLPVPELGQHLSSFFVASALTQWVWLWGHWLLLLLLLCYTAAAAAAVVAALLS